MLALILLFAYADPPKITISKETTYITGPLRADGMVDYLAYVNAPLKEIKPEDNAAVLLARAIGPSLVPAKTSAEFYRLLQAEPPSDGLTFLTRLELTPGFAKEDVQGEIYNRLFQCERSPWKAAEHLLLVEWLQRNEEPLKLVVEASKRKCFVEPVVAETEPPHLDVNTKYASGIRLAGELLTVRAMEKLARGRIDDAIADLDTIHRLSSLLIQARGNVTTGMAIVTIRNRAFRTEASVVSCGALTPAQALERSKRIRRLESAVEVLDPTNELERLTGLSLISSALFEGKANLFDFTTPKPKKHSPAAIDEALYTINAWHDRVDVAFKLPQAELERRLEEMKRQQFPRRDKRSIAASGRRFAMDWIQVQAESPLMVVGTRKRVMSFHRQVALAYLLRANKNEQNGYPAQIDVKSLGLTNDDVIDPLTEKPFQYRLKGGKAKLLSPGPNGELEPPGKLPNDDFIIDLP